MVTAYSVGEAIDHVALYRDFLSREDDRSGTVVMHHGMVKRPGKQVPDFSSVELIPLTVELDTRLYALADEVRQKFQLNQVLLVHRIGRIVARDTVLLAIVSAATRDRCFEACSFLIDEVKKEELIQLTEKG